MAEDTRKNKKQLKIGILTFWWSNDNYGQLLQCYALQKYLRDAGHDAFLIRYDSRNDFIRTPFILRCLKALNPVLLCKFLQHKIQHKTNSKKLLEESKLNDRHFDDFRAKYIVQSEKLYTSYNQLKENPPEADVYIVGSDQVWNFSLFQTVKNCKNLIHAYFLDFGSTQIKRISYAASWSCSDLRSDIIEEISPLLKKFDYVSVREKSGIDLCRKCGYDTAEFRCDPTLLLTAENYRSLYKENYGTSKRKNPYLFLYMLNNTCDFDIQKVYEFAACKNLEVVYVTGNGKIDRYEKTFATIPQWLSLIDNAEYVVTNSFHCCVFSLLFEKKFGVVPLTKTLAGMNSRIETLSEIFGIKPRWIMEYGNGAFSVLEEEVNPVLQIKNEFYLREVLNK